MREGCSDWRTARRLAGSASTRGGPRGAPAFGVGARQGARRARPGPLRPARPRTARKHRPTVTYEANQPSSRHRQPGAWTVCPAGVEAGHAVLTGPSARRPESGGPPRAAAGHSPHRLIGAVLGQLRQRRGRHDDPVVHAVDVLSALVEDRFPGGRGRAARGRGEDEQHRREGPVQGRPGVGLLPVAAWGPGGVAASGRRRVAVGVVALQLGEKAGVGHGAVDLHERAGAVGQEHHAVGHQVPGRGGVGAFHLPVGAVGRLRLVEGDDSVDQGEAVFPKTCLAGGDALAGGQAGPRCELA